MKPLILGAVCALCALTTGSTALAGGKKAKPIEHHDTVITSVAADSITIDADKVTKSFKITQFTEVTLRGQKAALTDLQPGMMVSVTMGADPTTASRIAAGDAPVHNDRPKPKIGKLMK